jgi:mRNA interferase HigB
MVIVFWMRPISQSSLKAFWKAHPETADPLRAWRDAVRDAEWKSMNDVLSTFPKSEPLNAERVKFPIRHGSYRLIASIHFPSKAVWIKFIGTHTEYDRIDPFTVSEY